MDSRLETFIVMESSCWSLWRCSSFLSPSSEERDAEVREGGGERSSRGRIFTVVPLGAVDCSSSLKSSGPISLVGVSPT